MELFQISKGGINDSEKEKVSFQSLTVNERDQDPGVKYSQKIKNEWSSWNFN